MEQQIQHDFRRRKTQRGVDGVGTAYRRSPPGKVSVEPGATLAGDIDLTDVIRDLTVTKKSDVHLFWAYKAPDGLHIPRWSGGWVFIPQQRVGFQLA